ncbi:MAG: 4-hydroxy-3-methylbut-2-enyl diphosphate reductase [Clostridia bacterium]|nr:4-hydroxy-3-methylbut-2-enyl diphosphate reductase [Clostridia bacterium]
MEIIVGKRAGFCGGVKRAVEGAQKVTNDNEGHTIYCLGNLVHNPIVMGKLFQEGLQVVESLEEAKQPKTSVIIRAHGVSKEVYEVAQKKEISLIDLTCPKVIQIHNIAEEYAKKGFYIFLTGEKKHAEVIGTASFCGEYYTIIENEQEIPKAIEYFQKSQKEKLLIISQTTYHLENFEKIVKTIQQQLQGIPKIVIKNTICNATRLRQEETAELASRVDCMIIIGGKNSSNTNKLYQVACQHCKKVEFIEEAKELIKKIPAIKGHQKIGIMAGASTPQNSIDEVIRFLSL